MSRLFPRQNVTGMSGDLTEQRSLKKQQLSFAVTTPCEAKILENLFEKLSKVSFGQWDRITAAAGVI